MSDINFSEEIFYNEKLTPLTTFGLVSLFNCGVVVLMVLFIEFISGSFIPLWGPTIFVVISTVSGILFMVQWLLFVEASLANKIKRAESEHKEDSFGWLVSGLVQSRNKEGEVRSTTFRSSIFIGVFIFIGASFGTYYLLFTLATIF